MSGLFGNAGALARTDEFGSWKDAIEEAEKKYAAGEITSSDLERTRARMRATRQAAWKRNSINAGDV